MPTYDSIRFNPPAPLALVTLRNTETGASCSDIPMLIDSGGDVTLLPQSIAELIGLPTLPNKGYELAAFDGSLTVAPVVRAEMIFLGKSFRGQFLLLEQEFGILGRNIINLVPILLDGPNLSWDSQ
ncbi:MAG: hypothetical protein ACRD82_20000 [Blastocatellia bacterium]